MLTDLEEKIIATACGLLVGFVFVGLPLSTLRSAQITKQQLNKTCNTNYSTLDVWFAGNSLTELCQIEKQQLTIKK
jgi:hypothetical protein